MFGSYAMGVLAVVVMSVAWVGVQIAWKRVFAYEAPEPDVLARRMRCGECSCTEVCDRGLQDRAGSAKEENS